MKKLDPRIKDSKYIFDCFNADEAKKYIGKKCYMTDYFERFEDVEKTVKCILHKIADDGSFVTDEDDYRFSYCLPLEFVAQEKRLRPYTFEEYCNKFPVERPFKFREKGKESRELFLIQNDDLRNKQIANVYVCIGSFQYTFDELFKKYELYDYATGVWTPFGVEE